MGLSVVTLESPSVCSGVASFSFEATLDITFLVIFFSAIGELYIKFTFGAIV